jgi:hypothetical protein
MAVSTGRFARHSKHASRPATTISSRHPEPDVPERRPVVRKIRPPASHQPVASPALALGKVPGWSLASGARAGTCGCCTVQPSRSRSSRLTGLGVNRTPVSRANALRPDQDLGSVRFCLCPEQAEEHQGSDPTDQQPGSGQRAGYPRGPHCSVSLDLVQPRLAELRRARSAETLVSSSSWSAMAILPAVSHSMWTAMAILPAVSARLFGPLTGTATQDQMPVGNGSWVQPPVVRRDRARRDMRIGESSG